MYNYPTKEEREQSAMGRFELVCEAYINGTSKQREVILSCLTETERQQFLVGCGLYHMFTDHRYYNAIKKAVGERIYKDAHPEMED